MVHSTNETGTIQLSDDQHVHWDNKIHGISAHVKELIKGFDKIHLKVIVFVLIQIEIIFIGIMFFHPKAIIRNLRDVEGIQIPTINQINHFLKYMREKMSDTKGSAMCLKDFQDFYTAHKAVPSNPDQIFVPDVSTEVVKEKGKTVLIFRIFFTTTRLLTFTQHVRNQLARLLNLNWLTQHIRS